MGKRHRKRSKASHGDVDAIPSAGVAGALAFIDKEREDETLGSWGKVEGRPQKRLKNDSNGSKDGTASNGSRKPALTFAPTHKINKELKIADLQNLLLYCLADGPGPQWLSISFHQKIQKAVVLMVPGLEKAMFTGKIHLPNHQESITGHGAGLEDDIQSSNMGPTKENAKVLYDDERIPERYLPMSLDKAMLPESLLPLANIFDRLWPIKTPGDDKGARLYSPLHAMLSTPVPKTAEEKKNDRAKGVKPAQQMKSWAGQRTPVTHYVASKYDLAENDYVLHPACCDTEKEKLDNARKREAGNTSEKHGWRDTDIKNFSDGDVPPEEIEKGSVTEGHTILALDCEMCMIEGDEFALTRVSIMGWGGEIVMDELVKPEKPIKDYLTRFSGITPEALADVTTTLAEIQARLMDLFHPRTILVGHSLDSDLRALKMTHPFIVDTSMLFPHPRGPPLKSSLKWLSQKYLSREIQKGHGTRGHDSVEDAKAVLDLLKQKCERGPRWGGSDANQESIFKRLLRTPKAGVSVPASGERPGKTGAIVDHGNQERGFGSTATHCVSCETDAEVVEGVKRAALGDPDGAIIPGGGVDFTWARLRDLEALRGWWNDNRNQPTWEVKDTPQASSLELAKAVAETTKHVIEIHNSLPPCTLFIVYSGSGDPMEMARLQQMRRQHKQEYATKKWDELSIKWTDTEEQALNLAASNARKGIGFVCLT